MFSHLLLFDEACANGSCSNQPLVSKACRQIQRAERTFRRVLPNFADWLPVFINDLVPRGFIIRAEY